VNDVRAKVREALEAAAIIPNAEDTFSEENSDIPL
jgi:hypothetical protein